jgi:hypothetical protein
MEKDPMTRDNFMVHNVNNPSALTLVKNADRSALKIQFLKTRPWKCDHEVLPWKKKPYDMGQPRGPQCKQPLGYDVREECRPTNFKNKFFENQTVESVTMKVDHGKMPCDMGQLRNP